MASASEGAPDSVADPNPPRRHSPLKAPPRITNHGESRSRPTGPRMGTDAPAFLLDRKWPLRIAVGAWLAVGLGAWFLAGYLDRPAQVVLGGLWLVGLGLLLRQFILSLFGPVLAYDILRVGRKPRQIWFRVAYAAFLAFLFTWVYFAW